MRLTIAERKHRKRAASIKALERSSPELARSEKARLLSLWAREVNGRLRSEGIPKRDDRGERVVVPTSTDLIDVARAYGLADDLAAIVTDAVRRHLEGPDVPSISRTYAKWRSR